MQENSKSFYEVLRESDPKLADQLDVIKRRGHEEWIPMLHFEKGSHGGYPHIRNVEHNADRLVPDKIKKDFSPGEIFLLLSSIFLHDIGKVIADNFLDKISKSPCNRPIGEKGEGCNQNIGEIKSKEEGYKSDNDPLCRNKNRVHIYESLRIIRENWGMLGLPGERIAEYCATIAFCHGLDYPLDYHDKNKKNICMIAKETLSYFRNTSLEPYGKLRIPLLASILRIADETDNYWTRSFQDYWFPNIKPEGYSSLVKSFRRRVEDVEFCCGGQCIIMHVPITRLKVGKTLEAEAKSLSKCLTDTIDVLKNWSAPLEALEIKYKDVFFEYHNCLYNNFDDLLDDIKSGAITKKPKYSNLFGQDDGETKETLKKLVEAVIQLSLGSLGYERFRWRSLEAKIGRTLTDRDKWLVERIYPESNKLLNVTFMPDGEYIKIGFDRKDVEDIYINLGIKQPSEKEDKK